MLKIGRFVRFLMAGTMAGTVAGAHAQQVAGEKNALEADSTLLLDEVTCVGTLAPLAQAKSIRMVTVLGQEEIAQAAVQSVNDLLKLIPSVDVRQRGALGAQTDVSIRGGNYEQIAVMLNGVSLADPQTGHNTFDFPVDKSEITRVEIIQGPACRVAGASSMLGAINIVTRPPAASSVDARVEGGSYGYLSSGVRGNICSGRWNNQLSASYTRSDGFSRNKQGGLNADYRTVKAFYQGVCTGEDVSVKWHAGLSVKGFGSNTFYGAKWDDQYEHTLKTFTALQADAHVGRLYLQPSLYWNHTTDRFELFRGDDAVAHGVPFNYHRSDVLGMNLCSWFDWAGGRTAFSAAFRNEDLVSTALGEPLKTPKPIGGTSRAYEFGLNRTNLSLTLEHNIQVGGLTLSAGVVAVKNSWNEAPLKLYPGVDVSYLFADRWKVFASYNTSLRMPSVTELYYSVGGHQADKNLRPEEVSAFEVGASYSHPALSVQVSVYHNRWKNMIDWVRDTEKGPEAPWESVNFTKVNAVGLDAQVLLHLQRWWPQRVVKSLKVAYSYLSQRKKVHSTWQSQYALEYLRHKLVSDLQFSLTEPLSVGLSCRWQDRCGSYTDTDGRVQSYQPYVLVDVHLAYKWPKWELFADLNNVFNKKYVDYGNVPQPGTWVIGGLKVSLP